MRFIKRLIENLFKRKATIYPYGFVVGEDMEKEFKNFNSMFCLWSHELEKYNVDKSFYALDPKIGEKIIVCKKEKGFFNPDSLVETIPACKVHVAFDNEFIVNESGWLVPIFISEKDRRRLWDDLNRITYNVSPEKYDNSLFVKVSSVYTGEIVTKISDGEKALAVYTASGDSLVFIEGRPLSYDLWDTTPVMKIFRKRSTLSKN